MSKINEPSFTKAIKSSAFQRSQLAEKATTRVPVSSALRTRISTTFRVFTAITSTKMTGSWRRTRKTIRIRNPEGQFFEGHQCLTFSGSMEALACTPVSCPVIRLHTAAFATKGDGAQVLRRCACRHSGRDSLVIRVAASANRHNSHRFSLLPLLGPFFWKCCNFAVTPW
jgi:hypothetical protein